MRENELNQFAFSTQQGFLVDRMPHESLLIPVIWVITVSSYEVCRHASQYHWVWNLTESLRVTCYHRLTFNFRGRNLFGMPCFYCTTSECSKYEWHSNLSLNIYLIWDRKIALVHFFPPNRCSLQGLSWDPHPHQM